MCPPQNDRDENGIHPFTNLRLLASLAPSKSYRSYSKQQQDDVISYIKDGNSLRKAQKVFGIPKSTMHCWLKKITTAHHLTLHKGVPEVPSTRGTYPKELKDDVIHFIQGGNNLGAAKKVFGIPRSTIHHWLKKSFFKSTEHTTKLSINIQYLTQPLTDSYEEVKQSKYLSEENSFLSEDKQCLSDEERCLSEEKSYSLEVKQDISEGKQYFSEETSGLSEEKQCCSSDENLDNKSENQSSDFSCSNQLTEDNADKGIKKVRLNKYNCRVCGSRFLKFSDMYIHRSIHFHGNYYICDLCDQLFVQCDELKRHRQTHTDHDYNQRHVPNDHDYHRVLVQ